MVEYLSNSQLSLYMQCSLKYRFKYVDRIPVAFKSSGLAFGSALHSVLAWLHQQRLKAATNGHGQITLERLLRIFAADWYAQQVETDIHWKEGETDLQLAAMAAEMLRLYFHEPANPLKAAEIPFVVPLVDPVTGRELDVTLEGYFDLVEEDDVIVEFKTSAQTMSQADADEHLQLTAYSYAYELLYHRPPKRLKIVDFVKHKKPKLIILETSRTRADYERFFALVSQVLSGIRRRVFFPRPSFLCKDCEYQEQCVAWRG